MTNSINNKNEMNEMNYKLGLILGCLEVLGAKLNIGTGVTLSEADVTELKSDVNELFFCLDRLGERLAKLERAENREGYGNKAKDVFCDTTEPVVELYGYQLHNLWQLSNMVSKISVDDHELIKDPLLNDFKQLKNWFNEFQDPDFFNEFHDAECFLLHVNKYNDFIYFSKVLFYEATRCKLQGLDNPKNDPHKIASRLDIELLRRVSLWEYVATTKQKGE